MQKIAVLTSGGDAPGMNYAVVSIARSASHHGMSLIGINRGFNGLIHKNEKLLDALFACAGEVIDNSRTDKLQLEAMKKTVPLGAKYCYGGDKKFYYGVGFEKVRKNRSRRFF